MHIILFLLFTAQIHQPAESKVSNQHMLEQINEIRTAGCTCGQQNMPAVPPLSWSRALEHSAKRHAKDMKRHNYFSHYSRDGKSVGDRLDDLGYNWRHIGENIASGQVNFQQVKEDWLSSQSHCEMIMNANMQEMGISQVGHFWVQHFGSLMEH